MKILPASQGQYVKITANFPFLDLKNKTSCLFKSECMKGYDLASLTL